MIELDVFDMGTIAKVDDFDVCIATSRDGPRERKISGVATGSEDDATFLKRSEKVARGRLASSVTVQRACADEVARFASWKTVLVAGSRLDDELRFRLAAKRSVRDRSPSFRASIFGNERNER